MPRGVLLHPRTSAFHILSEAENVALKTSISNWLLQTEKWLSGSPIFQQFWQLIGNKLGITSSNFILQLSRSWFPIKLQLIDDWVCISIAQLLLLRLSCCISVQHNWFNKKLKIQYALVVPGEVSWPTQAGVWASMHPYGSGAWIVEVCIVLSYCLIELRAPYRFPKRSKLEELEQTESMPCLLLQEDWPKLFLFSQVVYLNQCVTSKTS